MSKCWVVYSEEAPTLMGMELDFWIKDEAIAAFNRECRTFPFAEFVLYEVIDKDEPNEKWSQIDYREGAYNTKEDDIIE